MNRTGLYLYHDQRTGQTYTRHDEHGYRWPVKPEYVQDVARKLHCTSRDHGERLYTCEEIAQIVGMGETWVVGVINKFKERLARRMGR
jgi:hypothetical protein